MYIDVKINLFKIARIDELLRFYRELYILDVKF